MVNEVVRSEIKSLDFGIYSDAEMRQLSSCRISSSVAYDTLGNAIIGGLYDPRMGPTTQQSLPCPTCDLPYINCPGHLGHIELDFPVYHPVLFPSMYGLLRCQCASCHRFRIPVGKIEVTLLKLKMLEIGDFQKCSEIDNIVAEGSFFGDSAESNNSKIYGEFERCYENYIGANSKMPSDSLISRMQREIIDAFNKEAQACKQCDYCNSYSPALRKDGNSKIFEKPLAKRLRKSMSGMKKSLKSAVEDINDMELYHEKIGSGDDSDSDTNSDRDVDCEDDMKYSEDDKFLAPIEVEARMKLLWEAHREFLHFIWSRAALSSRFLAMKSASSSALWQLFFWRTVVVPPSRFRPPSDLGNLKTEHPQNINLSKILVANESMKSLLTSADSVSPECLSNESVNMTKLVSTWIDLQNFVNMYLDSSKNPSSNPADDVPTGIRQVLEKKEGLFRRHMMGKRVNYCCRSVISPDPYLGTNEIGIPVQFAKELHYPTPVTSWNVKFLRGLVENGPNVYPGANQIESSDGKIIKLDRFSSQERCAKAKLLLSSPGTKVYRHLIDGDVLLVNRQPTLHKPGIMAHKARVLQFVKEQTLRMNYPNCNAYNADFDGDEMNCHFLQNEIARAEATYICNTDNQYIVPTSGNPLRGLIQDHVAGGVKLTCKNSFLKKEDFQQLLYNAITGLPGTEIVAFAEDMIIPAPTIMKPRPLWTGKQLVSSLLAHICRPPLPPLHLDGKTRTPPTAFGNTEMEHKIVFRFGELLSGVLDKNSLGNSSLGVVHAVYELYGAELAGRILSAFGRLFTYYLQSAGQTCGIEDLTLTAKADKERSRLLREVEKHAEIGLKEFLNGSDPSGDSCENESSLFTDADRRLYEFKTSILLNSEKREGKVKLDGSLQSVINKHASGVIKACLPTGLERPFPLNNFSMMVLTGAKGSSVNQSQITCFLGQQALEGQRVPLMISGKSLPSFKAYDTQARAGGFVADRFLTGVRPQEYYFHCMAGREGLVDTAVKTSRSGYLQRCLVKHLEELKVNYDMTVRDSGNNVIQFLYGDDGLDPTCATLLGGKCEQMQFLSRNHQALVYKYSVHSDYFKQGFEMESARNYHAKMESARSLMASSSSCDDHSTILVKGSIVLARKKLSREKGWGRQNMHKKWFTAEILKKRKSGKSNISYTSYDLMYDDGTIEKHIPLRMRIKNTRRVKSSSLSHGVLVSLIKPGLPDPVMSVLGIQNTVGAISESMQRSISTYTEQNPDRVISNSTTETTVTSEALELLIWIKYMRSLACPGEAVGCVAAQSVGEPSTQMTLNTFHLAGHGGANVTLGIPRLREIIMTASRSLKTPTMLLPLKKSQTLEIAKAEALRMCRISVHELLHNEGCVEVGESLLKRPGGWERLYRIRYVFVSPVKIFSMFSVTFEELIEAIKKSVYQKLNYIIQLEMRRAGSAVIQRPTNVNSSSMGSRNADGDDLDVEDINHSSSTENGVKLQQKLKNIGIESDEDDGDDEEIDDIEQGTLRLGRKEEVDAYDHGTDESDSEEMNDSHINVAASSSIRAKSGRILSDKSFHFSESEGWIEMHLTYPVASRKLLMVQLAEQAAMKANVRETKNISRAYAIECDVDGEKRFAIQTEGVNFEAAWALDSIADTTSIKSNDIWKILCTYGVEAARQSIVSEIVGVFGVYGINVNPRHLSLIADFMTRNGSYVPMNRMGITNCPSPFLQMSFETTCTFLSQAAQDGSTEHLESSSARIVTGSVPKVGTGCFDIMFPVAVK